MIMDKHNLVQLESAIKDLNGNLAELAREKDFQELIHLIHQPGWTTPAEFRLVNGIVKAMAVQVKALADLKQALLTGSREISTKENVVLSQVPTK
jgi:hypothetical protein